MDVKDPASSVRHPLSGIAANGAEAGTAAGERSQSRPDYDDSSERPKDIIGPKPDYADITDVADAKDYKDVADLADKNDYADVADLADKNDYADVKDIADLADKQDYKDIKDIKDFR
jgi:hypothetical protein